MKTRWQQEQDKIRKLPTPALLDIHACLTLTLGWDPERFDLPEHRDVAMQRSLLEQEIVRRGLLED